jgi:hypothetical protein
MSKKPAPGSVVIVSAQLRTSNRKMGEYEVTPHGNLYVDTPEYRDFKQARERCSALREVVIGLRTLAYDRQEAAARLTGLQALFDDHHPSTRETITELNKVLVNPSSIDPTGARARVLVTALGDHLGRFEFAESRLAQAAPKYDPLVIDPQVTRGSQNGYGRSLSENGQ